MDTTATQFAQDQHAAAEPARILVLFFRKQNRRCRPCLPRRHHFDGHFRGFYCPHDPTVQYRECLEHAPAWGEDKCNFIFGTDYAGRDMLSRIIYGTRLSLVAGGMVVVLCLSIGIVFGLVAGFFRGWVDTTIMRIMDTIMSVPGLLMALVLVAILGPGLLNAMIAISITYLPHFVRLTRASYITESSKEYVIASKVAGAGSFASCLSPYCPTAWRH